MMEGMVIDMNDKQIATLTQLQAFRTAPRRLISQWRPPAKLSSTIRYLPRPAMTRPSCSMGVLVTERGVERDRHRESDSVPVARLGQIAEKHAAHRPASRPATSTRNGVPVASCPSHPYRDGLGGRPRGLCEHRLPRSRPC